jgi:hypothetical protein
LERPVVPEVKKNQQGSSCSTAAFGTDAPAWAAIASHTERSPKLPSAPIRQVKLDPETAAA